MRPIKEWILGRCKVEFEDEFAGTQERNSSPAAGVHVWWSGASELRVKNGGLTETGNTGANLCLDWRHHARVFVVGLAPGATVPTGPEDSYG